MLKRRHKQTAFDKAVDDWANDWSIAHGNTVLSEQVGTETDAGTDVTNGIELWEEESGDYAHSTYYISRHTGSLFQAVNGYLMTDPEYIPSDGRELLVRDEPDLFVLMGYRYGGSGDYFRVPDCRSREI